MDLQIHLASKRPFQTEIKGALGLTQTAEDVPQKWPHRLQRSLREGLSVVNRLSGIVDLYGTKAAEFPGCG